MNAEEFAKKCCDEDPITALVTAQNMADVHYSAQGKSIPSWLLIIIALLEKLLPLIPLANQQPSGTALGTPKS